MRKLAIILAFALTGCGDLGYALRGETQEDFIARCMEDEYPGITAPIRLTRNQCLSAFRSGGNTNYGGGSYSVTFYGFR